MAAHHEGAAALIFYVNVAVALERPPTVQEWRRYAVVAESDTEARLVALQMASCTSVMPVADELGECEE
jgi:hypothetical protein